MVGLESTVLLLLAVVEMVAELLASCKQQSLFSFPRIKKIITFYGLSLHHDY